MTITIRKLHLAIVVLVVALIAPATAVAFHVFNDVRDDQFYSDAVEWAFDNGITTGTSATTFAPNAGVTRGQNVTFAKRYDDNIVQPALAANAAEVAGLDTAQPFATTAFEGTETLLSLTPTAYVSVTVTAPVAGHVTVNSTAAVLHSAVGGWVLCVIVESTDIPPGSVTDTSESAQPWRAGVAFETGSLSGTRTFAIAAGATIDYVLACEEIGAGGLLLGRNLTAIFTPAP
jgi:hypothetical protein